MIHEHRKGERVHLSKDQEVVHLKHDRPLILGYEPSYVSDLALLICALLAVLLAVLLATTGAFEPGTPPSATSTAAYLRAYDEACAKQDSHDSNDDEHGLCASAGGRW